MKKAFIMLTILLFFAKAENTKSEQKRHYTFEDLMKTEAIAPASNNTGGSK